MARPSAFPEPIQPHLPFCDFTALRGAGRSEQAETHRHSLGARLPALCIPPTSPRWGGHKEAGIPDRL